ncbi:hypothetical protein Ciccas_005349 [Cichlidogyrus casuarinus]|uniref:Uncharacterized protein n=1 Tax=Cichlidogyrus casuarinus TaxID=1844966 RepID=A0ABD2Q8W1_9PLAT
MTTKDEETSLCKEDSNLRDLLVEVSQYFINLVQARLELEYSNYAENLLRCVDDRILMLSHQVGSLVDSINRRPREGMKNMKTYHEDFKSTYGVAITGIENLNQFMKSLTVGQHSNAVDSDDDTIPLSAFECRTEIYPNRCTQCKVNRTVNCVLHHKSREPFIYLKTSKFLTRGSQLPVTSIESLVASASKNSSKPKFRYRLFNNLFLLAEEQATKESVLINAYPDGIIKYVHCEINDHIDPEEEYSIDLAGIASGIRRTLMISKTGSILNELMLEPHQPEEDIKSVFNVYFKAPLIRSIVTESSIRQYFRYKVGNDVKCLVTREPNYKSIVSKAFRRDVADVTLILSHFIIIRKVTVTDRKKGSKTFMEPVYVEVRSDNFQGAVQTTISHQENQHQHDNVELDDKLLTIANLLNSKSHKHLTIFFLDFDKNGPIIRSLTARKEDVRMIIRKIVDHLLVTEYDRANASEDNDEELDPSKFTSTIVDRGTSILLELENLEEISLHFEYAMTEYATKENCPSKAHILQSANETSEIRVTTYEDDEDENAMSIVSNTNKGVMNVLVIRDESGTQETIEQPNFDSCMKILFSNCVDFAEFLSNNEILTIKKDVSFLTKMDLELYEGELNEILENGELASDKCEEKMPIYTGHVLVHNKCNPEKRVKRKMTEKLKLNSATKANFRSLEGAYSIKDDKIIFEEEFTPKRESTKKEIIKNVIFDGETLEEIGQIEFKTNLEFSVDKVEKSCNEAKGEQYSDSLELRTLVERRVRITESLGSIVTEHFVGLAGKECIIARITEPNYKTIVKRRTEMNDTNIDSIFNIAGFADLGKCEDFKMAYTDDHSKNCAFAQCGLFSMKAKVEYFVILKNELDMEKAELTDKGFITKFVQSFCDECENAAPYLLFNDDDYDRAPVTLCKEILSPIDFRVALSLLIDAAHAIRDPTDRKFILSRFKKRIQRYMNHGIVGISTKNLGRNSLPLTTEKKLELSKRKHNSTVHVPSMNNDTGADVQGAKEVVDEESEDEQKIIRDMANAGLQAILEKAEVKNLEQVQNSTKIGAASSNNLRDKLVDLVRNYQYCYRSTDC